MVDPRPPQLIAKADLAELRPLVREHLAEARADLARLRTELTRRLWIVGALIVAGNVTLLTALL